MAKLKKVLALALVVCCLLVTAGSLSVCADATNLIKNPGFETEGTSGAASVADWSDPYRVAATTDNPAHSGDWYAKVPADADIVSATVVVQPNTDYILSFWTRSSLENAGKIDIRFYSGGRLYSELPYYMGGEHLYQETFGIAHAAPEADEPDARLVWEKAEFAFTTPPKADALFVRIYNNASDPYFCLDDVSLALSGREPNLFHNGYMQCFKPGGVPSGINPTGMASYTDDGNGNTIAMSTSQGVFFNYGLPFHAGRYKLSFDYMNTGSATYAPALYMKFDGNTWGWANSWRTLQNTYWANTWQNYEVYFTVPAAPNKDGDIGYSITDFRIRLGYGTAYIKNMRVWRDETNVEYGFHTTRQKPYNETTMITEEWYRPITSVKGGTLADGAYTILPKAHYIPQTTGDEAYKLVTALYRVYADNTSALEKIQMVDGTATGGIVSNIYDTFTVPKLAGTEGYTYRVQSYIWNNLSDIQPMCLAGELAY